MDWSIRTFSFWSCRAPVLRPFPQPLLPRRVLASTVTIPLPSILRDEPPDWTQFPSAPSCFGFLHFREDNPITILCQAQSKNKLWKSPVCHCIPFSGDILITFIPEQSHSCYPIRKLSHRPENRPIRRPNANPSSPSATSAATRSQNP